MTYTVETTTHRGDTRFVVRGPDGHIVNGVYHKTEAEAERQAGIMRALMPWISGRVA